MTCSGAVQIHGVQQQHHGSCMGWRGSCLTPWSHHFRFRYPDTSPRPSRPTPHAHGPPFTAQPKRHRLRLCYGSHSAVGKAHVSAEPGSQVEREGVREKERTREGQSQVLNLATAHVQYVYSCVVKSNLPNGDIYSYKLALVTGFRQIFIILNANLDASLHSTSAAS